jgi:hypothetical protein
LQDHPVEDLRGLRSQIHVLGVGSFGYLLVFVDRLQQNVLHVAALKNAQHWRYVLPLDNVASERQR